jgi:hypothetical protein
MHLYSWVHIAAEWVVSPTMATVVFRVLDCWFESDWLLAKKNVNVYHMSKNFELACASELIWPPASVYIYKLSASLGLIIMAGCM